MADSKITALTSIGASTDPANDPLVLVDVSDTSMAASGTTKKVTVNQILGAGGTATLASATITGDLTVDISTLKVDSANNRVGINTASPLTNLHIGSGTGLNGLGVGLSRGATANFYEAYDGTKTFIAGTDSANAGVKVGSLSNHSVFLVCNNATQLQIDPLGVFTFTDGAGGTRMTLNATGLGVGIVPSVKLDINGDIKIRDTFSLFMGFGNEQKIFVGGGANSTYLTFNQWTGSAYTERMRIDSSGNVGVGVTPSAWGSGYKAIQGQIGGFALSNDNSSNNQFRLSSNAYFDTTDSRWEYFGTSTATAYEQRAGEHRFFNAISGSANTLVPFVQAMTLDASGNLLVGTTSSSETSSVGHKINTSLTAPWLATVGSASTNSNVTSSVYSTGAAAYRFYVGYGGTVFATNTTISAISDARLKENVQDIDVGLGAILALKPRKFDWKSGKGKDIKGDRGFIAQEFEQVFPNLVDEWKDAAPEGEAPYKSVRQDLIPVLVKAIQELTARVEALEA